MAVLKKLILILIQLSAVASLSLAQQESRMELLSSSHSRIDGVTSHMINYSPVYGHKGSTLRADSGYLYTDDLGREFFDAFGNVRITQPDGSVIYAQKLNYAAETQLAILTGNVRMVDGKSTLTTNYLTYNMRNRIGTYTGGGRIVNEQDTITSKNAWYFNQTKDAYFRYDVIVRTPDVHIFTDTMRYNSEEKTTYFYGPTNLKGKKGENLYTEEGYYNTVSELAEFYKNNLYTEKSRMLKGDTLYYDGKSGDGRAIGHVWFVDTADQFFAEGMIGLYNKEDESIMLIDQALITMVMKKDEEEPDSTAVAEPVPADPGAVPRTVTASVPQDSLRLRTDSLGTGTDSLRVRTDSLGTGADSLRVRPDSPGRWEPPGKVDSIYMTADTLYSRMIFLRDYVPMEFNLDREGGELEEDTEDFGESEEPERGNLPPGLDRGAGNLGVDSLGIDSLGIDSLGIDSLQAKVVLPDSVQAITTTQDSVQAKTTTRDSLKTPPARTPPNKQDTIPKDVLTAQISRDLAADSLLRQVSAFPTGGEADSLMQAALALEKPLPIDSLGRDSLHSDTAKTRIIKAYRNVRVYKSDLQAVADSAYYGYPDSMMRFFGSPMAWAQGSQLSGDSLYIQIKNEKIDNMLLINRAFIVNTKQDSSKYNQIKGRKITGFFTNGELERLFVDGNAESIAYRENKDKTAYTDMHHNRSSRIKLLIRNENLTDFIPIKSTEGTIYPLHLLSQEREILDGFIWKPGDRPRSKEDLLARKRVLEQEVIKAEDPDAGQPDEIKPDDPPQIDDPPQLDDPSQPDHRD